MSQFASETEPPKVVGSCPECAGKVYEGGVAIHKGYCSLLPREEAVRLLHPIQGLAEIAAAVRWLADPGVLDKLLAISSNARQISENVKLAAYAIDGAAAKLLEAETKLLEAVAAWKQS